MGRVCHGFGYKPTLPYHSHPKSLSHRKYLTLISTATSNPFTAVAKFSRPATSPTPTRGPSLHPPLPPRQTASGANRPGQTIRLLTKPPAVTSHPHHHSQARNAAGTHDRQHGGELRCGGRMGSWLFGLGRVTTLLLCAESAPTVIRSSRRGILRDQGVVSSQAWIIDEDPRSGSDTRDRQRLGPLVDVGGIRCTELALCSRWLFVESWRAGWPPHYQRSNNDNDFRTAERPAI